MHVMRGSARDNRRLDSWKEIAVFFDRDERTVKRWEKEKGLPVHRLRESSGARVFAFADELTQWMNSPVSPSEQPVQEKQDSPDPPASGGETAAPRSLGARKLKIIFAAIAAAALAGLGLLFAYHRQSSHPVGTAGTTTSGGPSAPGTRSPASLGSASVDPVARDLYLQGRYHLDKRTPDDLNQAVGYFNQAIARHPDYAEAYVGLASSYILLREFAAVPSEEAFPRALVAARKAVELDDSSAEAHNALAMVTYYWNWDAADAEREFRRALELDPGYVTAHHWYATFLMVLGRSPEALEQINIAQQLDPASTPIVADKAFILYRHGDQDQAISLLKQLTASQPAFFSTHQYLSHVYLNDKAYPDYLSEARKAATLSGDAQQMAVVHQAEKGYRAGGGTEMLQSILRLQKKYFEEGSMPAFLVAETYARLGNRAETLHYLTVSFQRHEVAFTAIRVSEPLLFLQRDPAFQRLVEEAGLPPLS